MADDKNTREKNMRELVAKMKREGKLPTFSELVSGLVKVDKEHKDD